MSDVSKPEAAPALSLPGNLPCVYADMLVLGRKNDGACVLSWQFKMPDGSGQEQARVVVLRSHLEVIVGMMCEQLDYHPPTKKASRPVAP